MIKATFYNNAKHVFKFVITGHAGAGEYGKDIVCSAVSALSITTANALTKIAQINPQILVDNDNGGLLKVTITSFNEKSDVLMQTLRLGLEEIKEQYGDYLKIEDLVED